ncbi:MAG: molybdate ABC transporter substrate-binding protein [Filomicrobium sp.]
MRLLFAVCVAMLLTALSHAEAAEKVTVFAAASTAKVVEVAGAAFEAEVSGGVRIVVSAASSGTLARQIEAGAPADLYVSANKRWMEHLISGGLIEDRLVRDIAGNELVLISPSRSQGDVADQFELTRQSVAVLLSEGRFAMADPDHAPVGRYGRQSLTTLGLWDVMDPRLVRTQNTTATVALVARGEVELGLTYKTDAANVPGVQIVATLDHSSHAPIRYSAAPVRSGAASVLADRFLKFLSSETGRKIIAKHGFRTDDVDALGLVPLGRRESSELEGSIEQAANSYGEFPIRGRVR